jgi:hypothetical protein
VSGAERTAICVRWRGGVRAPALVGSTTSPATMGTRGSHGGRGAHGGKLVRTYARCSSCTCVFGCRSTIAHEKGVMILIAIVSFEVPYKRLGIFDIVDKHRFERLARLRDLVQREHSSAVYVLRDPSRPDAHDHRVQWPVNAIHIIISRNGRRGPSNSHCYTVIVTDDAGADLYASFPACGAPSLLRNVRSFVFPASWSVTCGKVSIHFTVSSTSL